MDLEMELKYKIGDRVVVVHRMPANHYYSYTFNGSTGIVDEVTRTPDGAIYHLIHEDVVVTDSDIALELSPENAWYNEICLDPAPPANDIEIEDFESILG